ncbi:MAG: GDSL-type esterase/lipase family protein [Eubacteriales bacterium]
MKKRKMFFAVICLLIVLGCCMSACKKESGNADEPGTNTTDSESTDNIPGPSDDEDSIPEDAISYPLVQITDDLKINGRYTVTDSGIGCDHTASGIEFTAYCQGDVKLKLESVGDTYFSVWIDGIRKGSRIHAANGEGTVTVAKYLEEGVHTFRILKQTESRLSRTVLKEISLKGIIKEPPEDKSLYIEFIGDSITGGYGNLTTGKPADVGSSLYEDGTQAYAFLTAEALDADCSVVSCAGIGVAQGYVDFNISDFYPCVSYYRDRSEMYVAARIPDVVVINLGTNDYSKKADVREFSDGVEALVGSIREMYGEDVSIIWAYNMMNEGNSSIIRSIFRSLGGEEAGYFTVPLSRDTSGGNSHPSTDGHKASAEILSAYMSNKGFTDGTWREKIEVLPALDAEKDGSGWILSWNDGLPKTKKY